MCPFCCPKHNSFLKKNQTKTKQNPPKQNVVHCDWSSVDFQLFAMELPKLRIQLSFLFCFSMHFFVIQCLTQDACSAHWYLKSCLVTTKKFKKVNFKTEFMFWWLSLLTFYLFIAFFGLYVWITASPRQLRNRLSTFVLVLIFTMYI